jgi:hypothetical protein
MSAENAPIIIGDTFHSLHSALGSPKGGMDAFSVPQTPGGALSTYSGAGGPEVHSLQELMGAMRGTLDHLGGVFDSLGEQYVLPPSFVHAPAEVTIADSTSHFSRRRRFHPRSLPSASIVRNDD